MRYIIPALLLISCSQSNPKEAIVERQKAIKYQQATLNDSARANALTGSESQEQINNSKEVYFNRRVIQLQKEYDSLEVELKKY